MNSFLHSDNNDIQKLKKQIRFVTQQNQRLKVQLSDAKQLIQMNKFEIDVLSKNQQHDKKLIDVIYNLREQLNLLQQKNIKLFQNNQQLASEKMINEKLSEQAKNQHKNNQQLSKTKLLQMRTTIKSLQQKIAICEKSHQNYDNITGFVEKHRDILTPLEQAVQFKNKQNDWADQINLLKLQLQEHKKNQENLLLANGILRNKVVSLQAKLAMPNKNLGQILDKSLKRLMLYFIQTQKKMLTGDDSDSQQQDLQLIAPQLMSIFPQKTKNMSSDFKVPALDLLKVRNYQMKGIGKINEDLDRRNHLTQTQKIQRYQIQLQFTRRQLTKTMIDLKSQTERRKVLQKICQQLQQRNQLLVESNKKYNTKLQTIKKQYQSNKQKMLSLERLQSLQADAFQTSLMKRDSYRHIDMPKQKAREFQVNKYLQNVQSPFEFKLHLQLLAKDLDKNQKLKNLKDKKIKKKDSQASQTHKQPKMKRSTSNPFLYFNQRRDEILDIKPEKDMKKQQNRDDRERLQQTQYLPMGQNKMLKFNEDLQDLDDV